MNSADGESGPEDYVLVGKDLSGLWIQPGFVEGVIHRKKTFSSLGEAFADIFRRNLEYAVMLWNAVPVRLSYREDLPAMADGIIAMLDAAVAADGSRPFEWRVRTPNIDALWRMRVNDSQVHIDTNWRGIAGGYEDALNRLSMITMDRDAFLREWKLPAGQLKKALSDSGARLDDRTARARAKRLGRLEAAIHGRGRFYGD